MMTFTNSVMVMCSTIYRRGGAAEKRKMMVCLQMKIQENFRKGRYLNINLFVYIFPNMATTKANKSTEKNSLITNHTGEYTIFFGLIKQISYNL